MSQPRSPFKSLFWLALLALILLFWWKFQSLEDWWLLRGYNPPAAAVRLADEDTMTPMARHIFYVNHPDIVSDINQFRQDCPQSEQTIVLGCYRSSQRGIAVFDINDARLNGVEEVTAAHEMLHAAYDRLGRDEKKSIDAQLQNFYQNDLHDPRIINTIKAYTKTEPGDVVNEMHSVFGTEVDNLPASLQSYYQRYFTNRGAVVDFSNGYEGEFTNRLNQIADYDARLADLKGQIEAEENSLDSQSAQIQSDRARLDSYRRSNQIDAYNAAVSSFNAEVNAYNSALAKLRSDISAYNQMVIDRNAIANELRSLDSALDTRLQTQPAQ